MVTVFKLCVNLFKFFRPFLPQMLSTSQMIIHKQEPLLAHLNANRESALVACHIHEALDNARDNLSRSNHFKATAPVAQLIYAQTHRDV
jgi:hypothetical protein